MSPSRQHGKSVIDRHNFPAILREFWLFVGRPAPGRSELNGLEVSVSRYTFSLDSSLSVQIRAADAHQFGSIDAPVHPVSNRVQPFQAARSQRPGPPSSRSGPHAGYSKIMDKTLDFAKPAPSPKSRRYGPFIQPALQCARFVAPQ